MRTKILPIRIEYIPMGEIALLIIKEREEEKAREILAAVSNKRGAPPIHNA